VDDERRHGGSTTTAPGVDALNYAGSASSDSATYSNFTVEDGEKGYLTIAADINSASGTPTLQLTDGDGDYVEVTLYDATGDASNDTLLANSTGEGMVLQEQVGDLTVQGGGDGTFDSTEEITVSGDIDADVSVLDAERTRDLAFGERLVETDDGGSKPRRSPSREARTRSRTWTGSMRSCRTRRSTA